MTYPNVALIGCGAWGKNHMRVFNELGALRLICDADLERLKKFQAQYPDVEITTDVETVWRRSDIAGVIIATPAPTHAAIALQALEAGKDVLAEKPMALTVEEGEQLVETARRLDRILMVGHVLEYHQAVLKLGELLAEGALGRVQYIYSNRLNMGRIRTEENALWSFAPHDIAIILRLVNSLPEAVSCHGAAYLNTEVADVTLTNLRFADNLRAHIHVSWLHPFKEQRFVVVGTRQMAVFDDTRPWPEKLVLYPHRVDWLAGKVPVAHKAEAVPVAVEEAEPLRAEDEHFLHCIQNRQRPLTDGESGLRVLKVLQLAQQSLETGSRPVPVGEETPALSYSVHPTATVDAGAKIGRETRIWHYSHVMGKAQLGRRCVVGQNVFVADRVRIGDGVKIQNNVSVYEGVELEDYVFCGPSMVFTNVINPRSEIGRKDEYRRTLVKRGATLGANCTVLCGVTIGQYALVGAGAVVTKDVPAYGLMVGVPARRVGWAGRHGHRLPEPDAEGIMVCPESGWRYREEEPGLLRCLDWPEDQPL